MKSYLSSGIATLWFSIWTYTIEIYFIEGDEFLIEAVVATALCAGPVWYSLVEVSETSIVKRGVVAGFIIGIAVYPAFVVVYVVLELGIFFIANPFLYPTFFYLYALEAFGYLSIPAGTLAGGLLGLFRYYTGRKIV